MKAFSEFSEKGWKLETWKHRQSAEKNPHDGHNCPSTRQRQTLCSVRRTS